jgi:hypothetical protein
MTTSSMTLPSLDSEIPNGGWTLYFHPAKETRWHIDTYKTVCHVKTFRDLAQMFAAVTPTDWARGKFFFCPDGIPPLMENAKNIRGGAYSLRVDRSIAGEVMSRYILAAALGKLMTTSGNLVSCVRITPRRDFNILQVWNRDCSTYNTPSTIHQPDARIAVGEVQYKPHVEKKI